MTYKGNGRECHCAAYSENECACGADWTPDEVYELRARVKELVNAIDNEMVVSHLGVFNSGDDPKVALNKLLAFSESVGAFFAQEELTQLRTRITELEAEKNAWQGRFYVVEAENIALLAKEKQRLAVKQRLVRADKRS